MNIPIYYDCKKCKGKFPNKYYNHEEGLCTCCLTAKKDAVAKLHCSDGLCEDEAGYVEQLEMIIANSDFDGLPEDMGTLKAREIWERLHKKYYPANYA